MATTPKHTSNHKDHTLLSRYLLVIPIAIFVLIAVLFTSASVQASPQFQSTSTPIPQPTPTFNPQRLDKPVVASDNSEQLKRGSLIYWGICMACHGDGGQGLTDEWRDAFGVEDRNCWKSGCHGAHHPPWGFLIPSPTEKPVPALAGSGRLTR